MGRKSITGVPRKSRFEVRVTDEEKARLVAAAGGPRKLSSWILSLALAAAPPLAPPPKPARPPRRGRPA